MEREEYVLSGQLSELDGISGTLDDSNSLRGTVTLPEYAPGPTTIPPATRTTLGGIIVGENLSITEEGILSVDTATEAESDNTRPITSAAVYTEIGNINILLATI